MADDLASLLQSCPPVQFVQRKEQFLLAAHGIDQRTAVQVLPYRFPAPPRKIARFRAHVVEIRATEIQILQCKLLLCHTLSRTEKPRESTKPHETDK